MLQYKERIGLVALANMVIFLLVAAFVVRCNNTSSNTADEPKPIVDTIVVGDESAVVSSSAEKQGRKERKSKSKAKPRAKSKTGSQGNQYNHRDILSDTIKAI